MCGIAGIMFKNGSAAEPAGRALIDYETDDLVAVASEYGTEAGRLASLPETLHERTGRRVAMLVDEYDKPILDALEAPSARC